ncbi:MAG: hypothetical protein V4636_13135 [Pseudomonadota bacterium]
MIGIMLSIWNAVKGVGSGGDPSDSYYNRPDGVSLYLRPDGVSLYERP